ncbi:MAG: RNA polymerase sigma factor [Dysgonomonas sp.]
MSPKIKKSLRQNLVDLQPNMLNFAMTLTANRDEARDLTQETTLKALTNIDKFYNNMNFKGWIFTIMHNIFVNNYRRAIRIQTLINHTDNYQLLDLPQESGFESPESSFSITEINGILNSFSDEYKVPFTMHLLGYKYEEIAKRLKLPLGTVKCRIFYARKRSHELLKDYK